MPGRFPKNLSYQLQLLALYKAGLCLKDPCGFYRSVGILEALAGAVAYAL